MRCPRFLPALLILSFAGMLCSCWGYAEVYYEYPPDYRYVTLPEYDLTGTYSLRGFEVDYYDYYYPYGYLWSEDERDFFSFSGEMRIGPGTVYLRTYVEGDVYFQMSDDYIVAYTDPPYEGIFDFHYNHYDIYDYDDMSFTCSGYTLTTFSYICSEILGLCWEEWDHWEKVSDRY